MSESDKHGSEPKLPERSEEAANLAREGLDEIKHGDKEEGEFLLSEAKALDKAAAEKVVKDEKA
jgi:ribosomal protein S20